jgi:hypothetical protein
MRAPLEPHHMLEQRVKCQLEEAQRAMRGPVAAPAQLVMTH